MGKHRDPPSRQDEYVKLAAIGPPSVARGRFVGGHQSGLAGCKSPPLFKRGAPSCSSQGQRQGEPWGASLRPSAPTYLHCPPVAGAGAPGRGPLDRHIQLGPCPCVGTAGWGAHSHKALS